MDCVTFRQTGGVLSWEEQGQPTSYDERVPEQSYGLTVSTARRCRSHTKVTLDSCTVLHLDDTDLKKHSLNGSRRVRPPMKSVPLGHDSPHFRIRRFTIDTNLTAVKADHGRETASQ